MKSSPHAKRPGLAHPEIAADRNAPSAASTAGESSKPKAPAPAEGARHNSARGEGTSDNEADAVLGELRDRYLELTEFAPFGYVTLTNKALIRDIGGNGALLLGASRAQILHARFARFVMADDRDRWRRNFLNVLKNGGKQSIELMLMRRDKSTFAALLDCQRVELDTQQYGVRIALTDISDVAELRRVIADTKIAAIVFESQEGMVIADANNTILRVNGAFCEISGYSEPEIVGRKPNLLKSGRHDAAFFVAMWDSIRRSGSWQGEVWNRRKNGEAFPAFMTITAVKTHGDEVTHYVGTMLDITQRKAAEEEIQNLAFFDPLTGLPNRRLLLDRLHQALASSGRSLRDGALLFIDLDDFKLLNDTLGHAAGDLLLVEVAERLRGCVREGDTVARLGGDEFVIIVENLSMYQPESAMRIERLGEKILASLSQAYRLGEYERHITASVGITLFSNHQRTVEELMKRADLALYQAKAAGRNTLRFFDRDMQTAVSARAAMEIDLRTAFSAQEFVLYYQPQVNANGELIGSEALLRWENPARGLVSPGEFIPVVEQTGLIHALGLWVLQSACAQLADWADDPHTANLSVAVNVSAMQFHEADFTDQVFQVLDLTGVNPRQLKLELTETVLLEDVEDTIAKMNVIRRRGVQFALDDFGVGYSSLSYLKRLPLDQLKIDRSFIRNLLTDANDSAIAKMVIALGQSMNLDVIAEGVETEGQRNFLVDLGCRDYQGYLFSPPLPQATFSERFLSQH